MRRVLFLGLASVVFISLCGIGSAQADNGPHVSPAAGVGFNELVGTHRCANCHRANTTRAAFLRTSGQSGLCLTCHGFAGGSTTDVVDGVSYGLVGTVVGAQNRHAVTAPAALRGGGFDYALIASAGATKDTYLVDSTFRARNQVIPVLAAPQVTTSRHGLTRASTASGNSPLNPAPDDTVSLECVSCHNPHGNGSYRVLRSSPISSGTSAAAGVTIPDATVKVYTTTNYWLSADTSVPDGYTANITRWCTTCHEGAHIGTTIKMTGTTCVTCHVAHGSNATQGGTTSGQVRQSVGSAARYRSRLLRIDAGEAICMMCHNR